MAQPMFCDNGHGQEGFVMIQILGTSDIQVYCAPCYAEFCLGIAKESGLVDGEVAQQLAALEAAGVIKEAKPVKPRTGKTAPTPAPEPGPEPADEPADAVDGQEG